MFMFFKENLVKWNFIEKNISYIFLERIEEGEKIVFGFSVFEIFIIRM